MTNPNRIYSIALAVLALIATFSSGLLLYLAGASTGGVLELYLPAWSLPWVATLNAAYGIAIVITLSARYFSPEKGRRLSRLLNWALLPALPGGTIVGLYGLLMIDRQRP